MINNYWLRIIIPVMFLLMTSQIVTGVLVRILHFSFKLFLMIHGTGGILLFLLMLVHVTLNWNWIRAQYTHKRARKMGTGTNVHLIN